jgi:hypothetical protein
MGSACLTEASDAEVEHFDDALARQKQVFRLDIPVDDSFGVRCGENIEKLMGELAHLAGAEPTTASLEARVERLPLEQLHDEKHGPVLGRVVVEDAHGPPVIDLVGDITFTQKAVPQLGVDRNVRVEHLDRYPVPVAVRAKVHRGHTAGANEPLKAILRIDCASDARSRVIVQVAPHGPTPGR